MKIDVTTALDVVGLLLVACGLGWVVKDVVGWAAGLLVAGVIVLAASSLSGFLTRKR